MLKLTEKYSGHARRASCRLLFQRILQNTIHDHFRRQKVRSTWTVLLSAFGDKVTIKDDDYRPARDFAGEIGTRARPSIAAAQVEQRQIVGIIERALARLPARQREAFLLALLGRVRRRGDRGGDGLLGGQRQDPLLAGRPRAGRDAESQRREAMSAPSVEAQVSPMNTRESETAKKITTYLDAGTATLKAGTALSAAAGPGGCARARTRRAGGRPRARQMARALAGRHDTKHRRSAAAHADASAVARHGALVALAALRMAAVESRPAGPRVRGTRRAAPDRPTCPSTPTWIGDSRIGSRLRSNPDDRCRGCPMLLAAAPVTACADRAQIAHVAGALLAGEADPLAACARVEQARRRAQDQVARDRRSGIRR